MPKLESTDSRNKLEDLSGVVLRPGDNPYEVFIEACNNNQVSLVFYCLKEFCVEEIMASYA